MPIFNLEKCFSVLLVPIRPYRGKTAVPERRRLRISSHLREKGCKHTDFPFSRRKHFYFSIHPNKVIAVIYACIPQTDSFLDSRSAKHRMVIYTIFTNLQVSQRPYRVFRILVLVDDPGWRGMICTPFMFFQGEISLAFSSRTAAVNVFAPSFLSGGPS